MAETARPKILLIDDDELVRETVRLSLEHSGFDVATLPGAAGARIHVLRDAPDVVIVDLYMPEKSGLDLVRELKKDPRTASVPIMIFTGSNETIDVVSGIDAGAFTYVTKPVDAKVLVDKIRAVLEKPRG